MFGFICNKVRPIARLPSNFEFHASQNLSRLSSLRYVSRLEDSTNRHSFVVNYLVNSCGLTPKSALSASKCVNFESPENPDSVLSFFRNRGFSETQISQVVKKYPQILSSNPDKTILPKLQFFHSQGLSMSDIAHCLSETPHILRYSLNNRIVPSFHFLRELIKSDKFLKSCFYVLSYNLETSLAPKLEFLRDIGVPESNVPRLIRKNTQWTLVSNLEKFEEKAKKAKKMGFNPSKPHFVEAVSVLMSLSEPTWERKVNAYKRWDWSDEEIAAAFRKQPFIMATSEDKIVAVMDHFINKLGWESSFIAKNPGLITYSLKKRVIPRASVLELLLSKGLLQKDFRSAKFFQCPETVFLRKYINCYGEAPELLKLYGKEKELALSYK